MFIVSTKLIKVNISSEYPIYFTCIFEKSLYISGSQLESWDPKVNFVDQCLNQMLNIDIEYIKTAKLKMCVS